MEWKRFHFKWKRLHFRLFFIRLTVIASSAARPASCSFTIYVEGAASYSFTIYVEALAASNPFTIYIGGVLLPTRSLYMSRVCCFQPVHYICRRREGICKGAFSQLISQHLREGMCKGAFSQLISQHLREGMCASAGIDHR